MTRMDASTSELDDLINEANERNEFFGTTRDMHSLVKEKTDMLHAFNEAQIALLDQLRNVEKGMDCVAAWEKHIVAKMSDATPLREEQAGIPPPEQTDGPLSKRVRFKELADMLTGREAAE